MGESSGHIEQSQLISASEPLSPPFGRIGPMIDFAVAFLRRRYLIITVCLVLGAGFAALYLYAVAVPDLHSIGHHDD